MDGLLLAVALLSWCLCGVLLTAVGCLALKTLARLPGDGYNWRAGPNADKRGEELLREVLGIPPQVEDETLVGTWVEVMVLALDRP